MYSLKLFLKSKLFIFSFLLVLILTLINIYQFNDTYSKVVVDGVTSFSFWNYVRVYGLGQIILFTSPIIITIVSLSNINEKISTSFFKCELLRTNYSKKIILELLQIYLKGILIYVGISVLIFVVGFLLLPNEIIKVESIHYMNLFYKDSSNPFLYVFLYHFLIGLFCMFIVNIGLIVMYFTKKFSLVIITTFIITNALNFVIANISLAIANMIGNATMISYVYNINIFEGYMIQNTMVQAFIDMSILFVISFVYVIILYKSKEKVVLNFE